jgi:hypothetical protein
MCIGNALASPPSLTCLFLNSSSSSIFLHHLESLVPELLAVAKLLKRRIFNPQIFSFI